jgi:hypothetical protein
MVVCVLDGFYVYNTAKYALTEIPQYCQIVADDESIEEIHNTDIY